MPQVQPTYNKQKFEELILYVAAQCEDDPKYGAAKLAKLLFFIDFGAYGELGDAITGARYQLIQRGPAPKALKPVRDEMEARGEIKIDRLPSGGNRDQERVVALRKPRVQLFTEAQRRFIDSVVARFKNMNGAEISAEAKKEVGVKLADEGEDIPYGTVYISNAPWTPEEINDVRKRMKERGWARPA